MTQSREIKLITDRCQRLHARRKLTQMGYLSYDVIMYTMYYNNWLNDNKNSFVTFTFNRKLTFKINYQSK